MTFPLQRVYSARHPYNATITTDKHTVIGPASSAETVIGVEFIPDASQSGVTTNGRSYTVFNRGQAGAGTTQVATLEFITGVNLVAYDAKTIPLSGTAANLELAAGDVLEFYSLHTGTGILDPGGIIRVTTVPTDSAGYV